MLAERDAARHRFLARHEWPATAEVLLAADASFRRYFRLRYQGRRAVLMDAPPPQEDVRPFVRLAKHLRELELSAPRVFAADETLGFVLLEDLGDDTFSKRLNAGVDAHRLYALAVDVLIHLQARPDATTVAVPEYDIATLVREAALFTDWFMPAKCGEPTEPAVRDAYLEIWGELLEPLVSANTTLVLRDYHVDNLMEIPDRRGAEACGLLDFQDALIGSPAYDLVSLLEDARRDVSPELTQTMLQRYYRAFPDLDKCAFESAYALLGAQRHCKVAGIFVRLCLRDGKPDYLCHIPRVMGLLEAGLQQPALQPLKRWLDQHLPDRQAPLPTINPGRVADLF